MLPELDYKMLILQETTKELPAHIYFVSNDKSQLFGFIPEDSEVIGARLFSKPMKFDTRKRTFKEIK
jgi:hypothetical protein